MGKEHYYTLEFCHRKFKQQAQWTQNPMEETELCLKTTQGHIAESHIVAWIKNWFCTEKIISVREKNPKLSTIKAIFSCHLTFTKPVSNTASEVKQMAFPCILKAIINFFCYTELNMKHQSVSTAHFSDSNQDMTTYICPSPASHTSIHCFFVACLCRTELWEIQIPVLSSQDLNYNKTATV